MTFTRNAQQHIRELQARIADLERQVKRYEAEKNDKSARTDMKKDGKIDLQNISPAMAKQIIRSFDENYDPRAIQNIEDLRVRSGANDSRVVEYDTRKKQYDELKERFNL